MAYLEDSEEEATCWLFRWRGDLKYWEKKSQDAKDYVKADFGSTAFSIVLMSVSAVVMVFGYRLFKPVVFLFGLFGGAFATFYLIDSILDAAKYDDVTASCWILGIGSIVGGLVLGSVLLKLEKFAIFCLGAAIGCVCGYYAYFLFFHLLAFKAVIAGYDVMYWLCLVVPAIVFGLLISRLEKYVLILATAICGSFAFTLGLDMAVLIRINDKFNLSNLQSYKDTHSAEELPYVIAVFGGAVVLAFISIFVQVKLNNKHKLRGKDMVYFGNTHPSGIYANDMA